MQQVRWRPPAGSLQLHWSMRSLRKDGHKATVCRNKPGKQKEPSKNKKQVHLAVGEDGEDGRECRGEFQG